jgi:hypothetical protein
MALERHIERAGAAMASMSLGYAGHQVPERRLGQPLRNPAPQNAIAERALACDHENGPFAVARGSHDKRRQGRASAILSQAVQVDPGAQRFALATQAAHPPGLKCIGRPLGGAGWARFR